MLLLIRFVVVVLTSLFRSRIELFGTSIVRFTVLPNDCDLNFHLNAGRFVSFTDVARIELLGRNRMLTCVLRRGWRPIVGGALVRYRRSILPFERFDIRTRIVGWDEKWFYIEHVIEKDGVFCADSYVRALLRKKGGNVTPSEVLALVGMEDAESPALPELVVGWRAAEDVR